MSSTQLADGPYFIPGIPLSLQFGDQIGGQLRIGVLDVGNPEVAQCCHNSQE